jgi:hypothetical protein
MEKKIYFFRLSRIAKLSLVSVALFISSLTIGQTTDGLKIHYTFASASSGVVPDESGNGYNGTLMNAATVGTSDGRNVLILGNGGTDYLDMGSSVGTLISGMTDFSLSVYVYVATTTNLASDGNFVCCFANSEDSYGNPTTGGYAFLSAKRSRYAITNANYDSEQAVQTGSDIAQGRWVHMAYTQSGTTGVLYIDGTQVSTADTLSKKLSSLGATLYNFIGRSCFKNDAYLIDSKISDFRLYNRALTSAEVSAIAYPAELTTQYDALTSSLLTSEDLEEVTTSLNLPTTLGGVSVSWSSTNTGVIATNGTVIQPASVNTSVVLTATLSYVGTDGITYTRTKKFDITVQSIAGSYVLAKWNFSPSVFSLKNGALAIKDESGNDYEGTLKDVAAIRTIGTAATGQYNVVDLANNKGYFDMGTELGKSVITLNNFTIGTYFRVNKNYSGFSKGGNFIWNFSNTADANNTATGYMIGILNNQTYKITPGNWSSEAGFSAGTGAPSKDTWHHIAYSQNGTEGTLYLDGVAVKTGTVTRKPSVDLVKANLTGTLYNWIGRSCYTGDAFLKQTLIYGFELDTYPYSADDLKSADLWDVTNTITKLNAAYAADTLVKYPELDIEKENLALPDLSALTSANSADLSAAFITQGTTYPTISIAWSTNSAAISSTGVITQPDLLDNTVTITATLMKNGQVRTKTFTATVKAKSAATSDLLINYDFAAGNVNGTTVTDASDSHFTGTLMKKATVTTLPGYNVLDLPSDSAYFDMGTDCGKLIYGLKNYSISVYFLIKGTKTNLSSGGNFIYTFSNSANSGTDQNGYMFGSASNASHCVAQYYWNNGNVATAGSSATPSLGVFHHFVFTQNDTLGTSILDNDTISSIKFANIPSVVIPKSGLSGTLYNFLGRSCYTDDAYLAPAMISDFQLYKKVLTADEIDNMQMKKMYLSNAYGVYTSAPTKTVEKLIVNTTVPGLIQIQGLKGNEKVAVFDLLGRRVAVSNIYAISVKSGIYIVRVDNKVTKVFVQ